jgi:hypothetical protein
LFWTVLVGEVVDILILKKRSAENRKVSGRLPVHRVRSRKYGPVIHERTLRRTQDIAIFGPHGAGKSYWLGRLAGGAAEVWPGRQSALVRAVEPLADWTEQPAVAAWNDAREDKRAAWAKLRQSERVELLVTWCTEVRAVILVDDMHKLTGRKADVVCRLIEGAHVVVYTASEETRLPMSLRLMLGRRKPQVVSLSSAAAYDYTGALIWSLCILSAAMGAWPIAAAIGAFRVVGGGRRAAKQT